MIDTHIHLTHKLFDQEFPFLSYDSGRYDLQHGTREQLIQQFQTSGIQACIEPAIDVESNHRILSLAEKYPSFVFPAIGVHPTRTYKYFSACLNGEKNRKSSSKKTNNENIRKLHWYRRKQIAQLAEHPQVVAIGETGLDYHHARKEQHRIRQIAWFIWQIRLAHKKKLPVILHIRESDRDALWILRIFRKRLHGGVCHCYTGGAELAKKYTSLGLMIGIGGKLFDSSDLEQTVIQIPLEYILLETDGPFVKPICPELTKKQQSVVRNTSLILPAIAERIAALKKIPIEEVIRVTTRNVEKCFSININTIK